MSETREGGRNSVDLTEEEYVFAEFSIGFGKLFDHPFG